MPRVAAPSLGLVVVLTGVSTLGAEIATARLLAPAFGSSTIIWANTIAIVLVALALGAWFGGRLADRGPHPRKMHAMLLVGAGLLALTPVIAMPLLGAGVEALDEVNAPAFIGSLVASLLLVAVPLTLLGAVSPYAVRLALGAERQGGGDAVDHAGQVAGRLSALGTAGSLAGTFLASLLTIPLIGTRRTFLLFALLLAVLALWGLAASHPNTEGRADDADDEGAPVSKPVKASTLVGAAIVPAVILLLLLMPVPTVKAASGGDRLLEERETGEQYARVLQAPDGSRTMELGEGQAIHSLWREGTVMTGNYWDELLVLPQLTGKAPTRVLILGNAGGTTATAMRALDPAVQVDAVDYDGELHELGKRWFDLGGDRLRLLTGDARVELRKSKGDYDVILVDAYRQPYIPFHLSTREFFELARERLAPGGVVAVNVGHPEGDDTLEKVLAATIRAAGFGSVWRDEAQRVNTQLVASTAPLRPEALARRAEELRREARRPAPAGVTASAADRRLHRLHRRQSPSRALDRRHAREGRDGGLTACAAAAGSAADAGRCRVSAAAGANPAGVELLDIEERAGRGGCRLGTRRAHRRRGPLAE